MKNKRFSKKELIKQLESYVASCNIQAENFKKSNMITSQLCSESMAQAYLNVIRYLNG